MKRNNRDTLVKKFFRVFNFCQKNPKYKVLIFVNDINNMEMLYEEVIQCFTDTSLEDISVTNLKNSIEIKMANQSIFRIVVATIGHGIRGNNIYIQDTIPISFIENVIKPMQCAYISENNTVKNPTISYFSME